MQDIQEIAHNLGKNTYIMPQNSSFARVSIALGLMLLFISLYGEKLRYYIAKTRGD